MKKSVNMLKKYLLICGCIIIIACLTACTDNDYNDEDSKSQGLTEESSGDDVDVYEYTQEINEDEGDGAEGYSEGYTFSAE